MSYLSDSHREALALIDRHGKEAVIHAVRKGDACLETGDIEGAYSWQQIIVAIRAMQEGAGGTVH
jgi:hypothetical protein